MYDSRSVANTILDVASSLNMSVTNLSLQKIAYFCHGWYLAAHGRPLSKQSFEAWQFGPVLQNIYRNFKEFERSPITVRCTKVDMETGESMLLPAITDDDAREIILGCVKFYGALRAGTLIELSHDREGPWDLCWNAKVGTNPGMRIEDSAIQEYFSRKQRPF